MVAVARALSGDIRVLLLDEPFEGLAPAVVEQLFESFDKLRQEVAIVIVDHHLDLALALSDRTVALERGQVQWTGEFQGAAGRSGAKTKSALALRQLFRKIAACLSACGDTLTARKLIAALQSCNPCTALLGCVSQHLALSDAVSRGRDASTLTADVVVNDVHAAGNAPTLKSELDGPPSSL